MRNELLAIESHMSNVRLSILHPNWWRETRQRSSKFVIKSLKSTTKNWKAAKGRLEELDFSEVFKQELYRKSA